MAFVDSIIANRRVFKAFVHGPFDTPGMIGLHVCFSGCVSLWRRDLAIKPWDESEAVW